MIVEIDKSNIELALAELSSLSKVVVDMNNGFFRTEINNPEILGMSKSAYKIIGTLEKFPKIHGSIKAISHSNITDKEFAKLIWEKTDKKVNLSKPDVELHLFNHLVTKKIWVRKKSEKSHEWEYNHPTSTDPKISRAMINMAQTKKVFDPFCGAGGILIESKKMNLLAEGIDIDPIQIKRAKKNLEVYGKTKLTCADSFNIKWPEIIVTDLPYGRNSKIQKDFFEKFFEKVKDCRMAVVGMPSGINCPVKNVKFKTEIYLHKSLSKTILVLGY